MAMMMTLEERIISLEGRLAEARRAILDLRQLVKELRIDFNRRAPAR